MKKVLVGFDQPKLIKEVSKCVRSTGSEELNFVIKRSKSTILNEISDGDYDTVLLMEECGNDIWSMDELVQIKDSYSINLIPIISDAYKGTQDLVTFCNYGITSAVFIGRKGVYKSDEIFRMIYNPRTLKDARVYYGVSTVADTRRNLGGNILEETIFEGVRNALLDESSGKPLGVRYVEAISDLTPSQVGDFIKRLDERTLNALKQTVEFYDVLNILKQNKVIRSYHVPKKIKQQQKERDRVGFSDVDTHELVHEEENEGSGLEFESVVVADVHAKEIVEEDSFIPYEDEEYAEYEEEFLGEESDEYVSFSDEEDGDVSFLDEDGDISFADEEDNMQHDVLGLMEDAVRESEEDGGFSFSSEMEVGRTVEQPKGQEVVADEDMKSAATVENTVKKNRDKVSVEKKSVEKKEEVVEKTDNGKRTTTVIIVSVVIGAIIFILVLVLLFVKITANRRVTSGVNPPSGYDTLYNTGEYDGYQLEGGDVTLSEEANTQQEAQQNVPTEVVAPEEEMDFSVVNEDDLPQEDVVEQTFNDPSAFEDGKDYKGLDLVNMLNGNEGANCTLELKNGASVSISRGNASLEDFKPSGMYKCKKDGSNLIFVER